MADIFSIDELRTVYPDAVIEKDGKSAIDFQALSLILAREVSDLQDQLNEKDYQILRITERLDSLES